MTETKTQSDKFREAARQLETDEKRFNEKLKRLAKQKPEKGDEAEED